MSSAQTDTQSLSARPKRADAARNFDKLIAAGREAFTESGSEASLEDIARRAGVGIGTLYRNFPTRQALLEAVYVEEVGGICRAAAELGELDAWDALESWLNSFFSYATTKHALFQELTAYLDKDSEMFTLCRASISDAGGPLLARAQASGEVRGDVEFLDVIRMVGGIAGSPGADDEQKRRILQVALDGLRARR